MAETLLDVMSALYASEINSGIQSFWDGGFEVWLGDEMNGVKAARTFGPNEMGDAATWLTAEAITHFPNSEFHKTMVPEREEHMKSGVELIAEERAAQVTREGWTPEHDDEHDRGELAAAAACYAFDAAEQAHDELREGRVPSIYWPWDAEWWKPKDQKRNLVRAGALIAAEIDRLQRKGSSVGGE